MKRYALCVSMCRYIQFQSTNTCTYMQYMHTYTYIQYKHIHTILAIVTYLHIHAIHDHTYISADTYIHAIPTNSYRYLHIQAHTYSPNIYLQPLLYTYNIPTHTYNTCTYLHSKYLRIPRWTLNLFACICRYLVGIL